MFRLEAHWAPPQSRSVDQASNEATKGTCRTGMLSLFESLVLHVDGMHMYAVVVTLVH